MMSTEENKKEGKPAEEKKELTPQQLQKRKKMVVFPLLFLLFAGCMWLIFAPSGDKKEEEKDGFNTDLPTPKGSGIVSDKRDAYQQEAMRAKEQEKMRSLEDFAFMLGDESPEGKDVQEEKEPYYGASTHSGNSYSQGGNRAGAFQSSASHYQDINRQLGSFYEQPATEEDEQAQLALEWRIQELERQLQEKDDADEQLALIEKSYEIASRYMPTEGKVQPKAEETPVPVQKTAGTGKKVAVQPVSQVTRNVVSLLAAPMTDAVFVEEYSKPRNQGFHTAAGNEEVSAKNSINACISKTVTVTDGQEVRIRLLEPMRAGDVLIPENTVISGSARLAGERMNIAINYIQYAGNVIPVEMVVFDLDGNQGISVPGSEEINAVKEVAANMGTSMGSSITITDDAASQLLADLGRSAIQGVSQYVGKKMRTVKVTLKAGHRILLLPPMQ